jgi:predicted phage terminase large subunit-like protein
MKDSGTSEWEVIELPAILPSGDPLWPEFWTKGELEAVKADIPVNRWNAQYMQQPTSEEGAIIKREWWKLWDKPRPPKCDSVIVSWDTAFETKSRSDYSACTTWGVFQVEGKNGKMHQNLILLDAFREKMEFPELKKVAKRHYDFWNPDALIVEASAAGIPLIQEMRAYGIPVEDHRVSWARDKKARVNAISDMFQSGFVWYPDQRWAHEVIEECAEFPNGQHDDYVDTVSQALLRARKGGLLLASDYEFGDVPLDDMSIPLNPY